MDDVGITIRNIIFRKLKPGEIVVHTPKEFFYVAMKLVPSIITVYLPISDKTVQPESIHQLSSSPETLSIHKFVQQINERGYCRIEFFKTVVGQEAFHTKWYKKVNDVVCSPKMSNKNDNECSTWGKWYTDDRTEWLQCPISEQWFHKTCFYV